MPKLNIDRDTLANIVTNIECIGVKTIFFKVMEKKLYVRQRDASASIMMIFSSNELDTDVASYSFSLSLADTKNLLKANKEEVIAMNIGSGDVICNIGRVTKRYPQTNDDKFCEKVPAPPFKYKVSISEEQIKIIKDCFGDIKEPGGTIEFTTDLHEWRLSYKDTTTVRSTDVEFYSNEMTTWEMPGKIKTAFRIENFIPMLDTKIKGAEAFMEFDDQYPVKLSQKTDKFSIALMLAPIIYD
jgi:hypothetical protein